LFNEFKIHRIQRDVERRGRSVMDDFAANDNLFEMLCKRFGDPPGRRLHANFPGVGKCGDWSDVAESPIHGD
jgi:hypothetical protein